METSDAINRQTVVVAASWLKTHERLIIVVLVLLVGGWLVQHFLDNIAAADKAKADIATQTLNVQIQKDQALSQQVAASTAQYQALVTSLTSQNAQLINTVQLRNSSLTTQQTADKSLAPSAVASRWSTLVNAPQGGITSNGQTIEVTPDAALGTLMQLEQVPVLTANFNDGKVVLQNTKDELASANTVIVQQKADITGLNVQLTDQKKAATMELNAEKAAARKSKLKWFGAGFLTGYVAGKLW